MGNSRAEHPLACFASIPLLFSGAHFTNWHLRSSPQHSTHWPSDPPMSLSPGRGSCAAGNVTNLRVETPTLAHSMWRHSCCLLEASEEFKLRWHLVETPRSDAPLGGACSRVVVRGLQAARIKQDHQQQRRT